MIMDAWLHSPYYLALIIVVMVGVSVWVMWW